MRDTPAAFSPAITCPSMGRPATLCRTMGVADFIRVPWPAANMIAALVMASGKSRPEIEEVTICDTILPGIYTLLLPAHDLHDTPYPDPRHGRHPGGSRSGSPGRRPRRPGRPGTAPQRTRPATPHEPQWRPH